MRFSTGLALLAGACTAQAAPTAPASGAGTLQTLHQFPNLTWVENLAVRENGQVLVTLISGPSLFAIDPEQPSVAPVLIHNFTGSTSVFGIAETTPDVFAVISGNFSIKTGKPVPGTSKIWSVDFSANQQHPKISEIAPVPQATFLNGMCSLPQQPQVVLLGDLDAGQIYRMDTHTGSVSVAVPATDPAVGPAENKLLGVVGVNGLHVVGDELYVSNSGHGTVSKFKIHPNGAPVPGMQPQVLQNKAPAGGFWDDFAVNPDCGDLYLASGSANEILRVTADGQASVFAGRENTTEIAQPTSAAFSRGKGPKRLFVTTAGDLAGGGPIVGGQVLAITL